MASRLKLQNKLEELLGSRNVYYKPPASIKISYPAIVYSKSEIEAQYADDIKYLKKNKYSITVVSNKPDNTVIDKLLDLPYSEYDTQYKSDNLYHDVISLYF